MWLAHLLPKEGEGAGQGVQEGRQRCHARQRHRVGEEVLSFHTDRLQGAKVLEGEGEGEERCGGGGGGGGAV